jgi:DNA-binding NtrC family response regulator
VRCALVRADGESWLVASALPARRLLVVDDDEAEARALASALAVRGFDVTVTLGAEAALALLRDGFRPAVVLTDLTMPGVSGEDFVDAVREHHGARGIAIIAVSACRASLQRVRDKVAARVEKPFELERLVRSLDALCRGVEP